MQYQKKVENSALPNFLILRGDGSETTLAFDSTGDSRRLYQFLVPRCLLRPLEEVCVHVTIIATEGRVKDGIWVVKGIDKWHCFFTHNLHERVQLSPRQVNLSRGHVAILGRGRVGVASWSCDIIVGVTSWSCDIIVGVTSWSCDIIVGVTSWSCDIIVGVTSWSCDIIVGVTSWSCDIIVGVASWSCDIIVGVTSWSCDIIVGVTSWSCDIIVGVTSWSCDIIVGVTSWSCDFSGYGMICGCSS